MILAYSLFDSGVINWLKTSCVLLQSCFFFCFVFYHRKLGASEGTINQEIQRYQQLESVAVNDIRRDVRKKLRRSSMRVNAHLFTFPDQQVINERSFEIDKFKCQTFKIINEYLSFGLLRNPFLTLCSSSGRLSKG